MAEVTTLGQAGVIGRGQADVARLRERNRQRRMQRSLAFFGPLAVGLWYRQLTGDPAGPGFPHPPAGPTLMLPQIILVGFFGAGLLGRPAMAGTPPHRDFRPPRITTRLP